MTRILHSNDSNESVGTIVFPQLSYQLTGIFYDIHNKLGRHLLEKQYADAFEAVAKTIGIVYKRETRLSLDYAGQTIYAGTVDFVINEQVAVDFKAKKFITKDDYNQMLRYLKAGKLHLGLIVNFRSTYLKPKRVLNNDFQNRL